MIGSLVFICFPFDHLVLGKLDRIFGWEKELQLFYHLNNDELRCIKKSCVGKCFCIARDQTTKLKMEHFKQKLRWGIMWWLSVESYEELFNRWKDQPLWVCIMICTQPNFIYATSKLLMPKVQKTRSSHQWVSPAWECTTKSLCWKCWYSEHGWSWHISRNQMIVP